MRLGFSHALSLGLLAVLLVALAGCAGKAPRVPIRGDSYYVSTARPRVIVRPPDGASLPMAKLIARYVVRDLNKKSISAEVGNEAAVVAAKKTLKKGANVFVLNGVVKENTSDPRIRYRRVLQWMVSDVNGRVIATYTQGIDGTSREWNFGSARLLNAIGFDAAGPISQIVFAEIPGAAPARFADTSWRQGVFLEGISGVSTKDAKTLMAALKKALRTSDILVTQDVRQAKYRLLGAVSVRTSATPGRSAVRIVWTVATLDREVVGRAVQENTLRAEDLKNGWSRLAGRVGGAAAVGVERILNVRPDSRPATPDRTLATPPVIALPGVPGRAPPPPR